MKKIALVAAMVAFAVPASADAANRGALTASECGAYHGMFALGAHGFFQDYVPLFAQAGDYKHGTVGDRASNPICRR